MRICPTCEQEKQDDEFYSHFGGGRDCKDCCRARVRRAQRFRQEESLNRAKAHGQRWSPVEDEMIEQGLSEGMSYHALAELLERSYWSINHRIGTIRRNKEMSN